MTKTNTTITRFEEGDFWIDIIDCGDTWEAWLTRKDYGVSDLMFGCSKFPIDDIQELDFDNVCELAEKMFPFDVKIYNACHVNVEDEPRRAWE